jgi:REP element-mobilizing transposase RayT
MRRRALIERRLDDALDRGEGFAFMRDPLIADCVAGAITFFERQRYELAAWCVMPNHVHAVVRPLDVWRLPQIVHSWKSWSAKRANTLLGRCGAFWQREYFDRVIRDDDDLIRTVRYVLDNPSKAGLAEWRWSSAGWKPAVRQA